MKPGLWHLIAGKAELHRRVRLVPGIFIGWAGQTISTFAAPRSRAGFFLYFFDLPWTGGKNGP
jgi:hypothetical protein